VDDRGSVCLEEEVEKLRRAGLSPAEISARMGVDAAWVESLVAMWEGETEEESD
jgi:hypothetical protein